MREELVGSESHHYLPVEQQFMSNNTHKIQFQHMLMQIMYLYETFYRKEEEEKT